MDTNKLPTHSRHNLEISNGWTNFDHKEISEADGCLSTRFFNDISTGEEKAVSLSFTEEEDITIEDSIEISGSLADKSRLEIIAYSGRSFSCLSGLLRDGTCIVVPTKEFGVKGERLKEIRLFSSKSIELEYIHITSRENRNYSIKLKINLHSGIGDCIRALSVHSSLQFFADTFHVEIFWSYAARGLRDSGWRQLLETDILGRNKMFTYVDEDDFDNIKAIELFNGYTGDAMLAGLFVNETQGIDISLTSSEAREVEELVNSKSSTLIGIQLEGNDEIKRWMPGKHYQLCRDILEKYPQAMIYILDAPQRFFENVDNDDRIISLIGKTSLAQNIHLIQKFDLWIAPDSFSKYVRRWQDGKQILLCSKAPYVDPKEMLIHCFDNVGLCHNPNTVILGLDYEYDLSVTSSVVHMEDISVSQVMERICEFFPPPSDQYNEKSSIGICKSLYQEHIRCFMDAENQLNDIDTISRMIYQVINSGGKLLICGNGGSAGDAQHMAAELIGRFEKERKALPAIALSTDSSCITAIGNDYSFDEIFARQVKGLGKASDVLLAISTSGNSQNIISAASEAKVLGMKVLGFSGASGGSLKGLCDFCLCAPSTKTARIQELHIFYCHCICALIESFLP